MTAPLTLAQATRSLIDAAEHYLSSVYIDADGLREAMREAEAALLAVPQEPQAQERCVCQQVPCVCDEQLLPAPAPRSAEAQAGQAQSLWGRLKGRLNLGVRLGPAGEVVADADCIAWIAEALAAAPAQGWQPIATAPKDGTPIIIHTEGGLIGEARWQGEGSDEGWWWAGTDPGDYHSSRIEEYEVAHWMPLPGPPSAPTAGETK